MDAPTPWVAALVRRSFLLPVGRILIKTDASVVVDCDAVRVGGDFGVGSAEA